MELKEKLSRLRRKQGWTQDELALKLSVTRQAVSKWERGVIAPTAEKLIALSRLYGIPLDDLVNGEPPSEEAPAAAVAVAEKPEDYEKRGRPSPLRLVGAAVLAGCVLLIMTASVIVIWTTVFREPEQPKNEIIWTEDMEGEKMDFSEINNMPVGPGGIMIIKDETK